MTITELRVKRAKAWEDAKAFLDSHRGDNGCLSAEDDAVYNKMTDALDAYQREIDRIERAEQIDAQMAADTSNALVSKPGALGDKTGRASDEYHKAFLAHIRKRAVDALQEDTNSEGGYLVPVEFERRLVEGRDKVDPIYALAGRITMGAHEKNVPVVTSAGEAAIVSEEGAYPDSDDSFSQVTFKAYKFGRICKASEELIADSAFDIEAFLRNSFARSIGKAEAGYLWTGTGTSQPQGIMTGAQTGVTAASASKITADEIIDLYYSVPEQYREGAAFVFNDATVKEIRKLKDGNGQYLWTPAFGAQPATILGKPVYTSEHIATIATGAKVGAFGNFRDAYWIGDRQGFTFLRLGELYAANGQIGFRGSMRSDGRVMIANAVKTLVMG